MSEVTQQDVNPGTARRTFDAWAGRMLAEHFGFDSFRPRQLDVVNAILNRRDVLAVMPTGAGKSVCYQIPSCASSPNGAPTLTVVVTPLRALMRDQVQQLETRGIPAAMIDSGTPPQERDDIAESVRTGRLSLLYVAPERLASPSFTRLCRLTRIRLVAVDEAHCVLQWGQDFRPDYLSIRSFIESLPARPVVAAFTATATPQARDAIAENLGLVEPLRVSTSFDRPNLTFGRLEVSPGRRVRLIADYANGRRGESGIVYCTSRKRTEELAEELKTAGVNADFFHARMGEDRKSGVMDAFLDDRIDVIVATTAFGMGVDKPDVRWVINDGLPASMEEYYQEAGRAGRDGQGAECHLLWSAREFTMLRKRIDEEAGSALESPAERMHAKAQARARLRAMDAYCTQDRCLRRQMLAYFGERVGDDFACAGCDVCEDRCGIDPDGMFSEPASGRPVRRWRPPHGGGDDDGQRRPGAGTAHRGVGETARRSARRHGSSRVSRGLTVRTLEVDPRLRRQIIDYVSAIHAAKGNGVGVVKIVNGLRGSRAEGVLQAGLDRIEGYGCAPLATSQQIRFTIRRLLDEGTLVNGPFKTLLPADAA